MPDVLILGADGFIGSHLTEALVARGLSVRAFDRMPDGRARNVVPGEGVELFRGDFLNADDVRRAMTGARIVIHLVSTTTPASSGADPLFDLDTNVRGSVRLFEIARELDIERVVFASTGGAIYGRDQDLPFKEVDAATPRSPYAVGKLAIEGYLRFYRENYGLDTMALRISNPYGERQGVEGVQGAIPIFLRKMILGDPITVYGDGSMVRDYLYVGDLARMFAHVVDKPAAHYLYNVGSGVSLTVRALLDQLEDVSGLKGRIIHEADRATDVHRVVLDSSRFVTEFGVQAETPLSEGIARTLAYVRSVVGDATGGMSE